MKVLRARPLRRQAPGDPGQVRRAAQVAGLDRRPQRQDPHLQLPAGARHRPPHRLHRPQPAGGVGRRRSTELAEAPRRRRRRRATRRSRRRRRTDRAEAVTGTATVAAGSPGVNTVVDRRTGVPCARCSRKPLAHPARRNALIACRRPQARARRGIALLRCAPSDTPADLPSRPVARRPTDVAYDPDRREHRRPDSPWPVVAAAVPLLYAVDRVVVVGRDPLQLAALPEGAGALWCITACDGIAAAAVAARIPRRSHRSRVCTLWWKAARLPASVLAVRLLRSRPSPRIDLLGFAIRRAAEDAPRRPAPDRRRCSPGPRDGIPGGPATRAGVRPRSATLACSRCCASTMTGVGPGARHRAPARRAAGRHRRSRGSSPASSPGGRWTSCAA